MKLQSTTLKGESPVPIPKSTAPPALLSHSRKTQPETICVCVPTFSA
jgi:hypothetical protein